MAKKLKTELSVDNTKAIRSTKQAKNELNKFGKAGDDASKKTTKGLNKTGGAADEFTRKIGFSSKGFGSWSAAGVAAAGAIALAMVGVVRRMQEVSQEQIALSKRAAELARGPDITALAEVLGLSRTEALRGTFETAGAFDVSRQSATDIQFQIASAIGQPSADPSRFAGAERIAGQFAAVTGATGETAGKLVGTALIAGLDPELFARQAQLTARGSKLNTNQLVTILNELTPLAQASGIDLNWLRNKLGSLSNVIPEPSKLKTTMERLIRNAAVGSDKLRDLGLDVDNLSAGELIDAQIDLVGRVGREGPVALRKLSKELELPGEGVQDLLKASSPLIKQKEREIGELVATAQFGALQRQFDSPEFNDEFRRLAREELQTEQAQIFGRGVAGAPTATALQRGQRRFQEQLGAGGGRAEVAEAIPLGIGQTITEREFAQKDLAGKLRAIISSPGATDEQKRKANDLLGEIDPLGVGLEFGGKGLIQSVGEIGIFALSGGGPLKRALGRAEQFSQSVAVQINQTQVGNGESTADRTQGRGE